MLDTELYEQIDIGSWNDLIKHGTNYYYDPSRGKQWIFKGKQAHTGFKKAHQHDDLEVEESRNQKNQRHTSDIVSSLERVAKEFQLPVEDIRIYERESLREFKRRLHHYTANVPGPDDTLEWLALMRHHGAPTRLVDFTYSFYVAVFFAVEEDNGDNGYEVWAINADHFKAEKADPDIFNKAEQEFGNMDTSRQYGDKSKARLSYVVKYLHKHPRACVHPVNPFRLNERLTIQQGTFLFPGDISQSFEQNLSADVYKEGSRANLLRFKIHIDLNERKNFLKQLNFMNINKATLFPGLDGFSQSLWTQLPDLPRKNNREQS